MKLIAIIQARMSSKRLPGKVLKLILGEPMLYRQVERVRNSEYIQNIIIATSIDHSDDAIETLCVEKNISYFRGSLDDVLDRFYNTACWYKPDYVVRLTGDCPLADPKIIDSVIQYCIENDYDYVSNALEPTYPDGLDTEVMKFKALEKAWISAKLPSHREHVTPFLYSNPQLFRIGIYKSSVDYSSIRLTVDEEEDFKVVESIYKKLYNQNAPFLLDSILRFLNNNDQIVRLNNRFERNEGFKASLDKDEQWIRNNTL